MRVDYKPAIEAYLAKLKETLDGVSRRELDDLADLLVRARQEGRRVYTLGNGGSAATASHFAADFNKGLSYGRPERFRFVCLADNVAILTAYANDVAFEDVFVEQLKNHLEPGDVVIAISGSGRSPNVVKAVAYANEIGAVTVALTGFDGGPLRSLARHGVHVPVEDMQIAEDIHLVIDHLLVRVLETTAG
jgi:D-sedoheptulose 7-phosphate isomerase